MTFARSNLTPFVVMALVKWFGKMLSSFRGKQLCSLRSLPNRWRISGTIGCALRSAFKKTHPPTSPFVFQESRALNNPAPIKVILIPSTWNQLEPSYQILNLNPLTSTCLAQFCCSQAILSKLLDASANSTAALGYMAATTARRAQLGEAVMRTEWRGYG